MDFSLVLINRRYGNVDKTFDDAILPIYFGLRRLGYEVEILRHTVNPKSKNILFGTINNPVPRDLSFPANSIVMNLEQFSVENGKKERQQYLNHLKQFEVWDYSKRNIELLSAMDISATYLPFGYVPEMTRLSRSISPIDDVLFYGQTNPRRQFILDKLSSQGLRVNQGKPNTFGRTRDVAIAESKLYLNIHRDVPVALEVVRLGYLWANHCAIVSELGADTEIYPGLEDACAFCSYDEIVPAVKMLVADNAKLKQQAEKGFEAFSKLDLTSHLETLVGRKSTHIAGATIREPRPNHLNVGSGRDFWNDALNVDINKQCNPDLVLDISKPLPADAKFFTERFGEIELARGSFSKITAYEVLEHVFDLTQTMRNFLDLLCEGGTLTVSVPYDLSCGAWQDPTHRRGFNENSWMYFCKLSWYLGWEKERFSIEKLHYMPSSWGKKLLRSKRGREKILRSPRAIDGMLVVLKKVNKTQEEIEFHHRMFRVIQERPMINWEVCDERASEEVEKPYSAIDKPTSWWLHKRMELVTCVLQYHFCKHIGYLWMGREKTAALKRKRQELRTLFR